MDDVIDHQPCGEEGCRECLLRDLDEGTAFERMLADELRETMRQEARDDEIELQIKESKEDR